MMTRRKTIGRVRQRRPAEAGVTLVELLISMVLLVVITGFLVGGIAMGRRAFSADRVSSREVDTATALETIGSLVGTALPIPAGKVGPQIAFEGRRDAVEFVGLSAGHALPGGPLGFRLRRNGAAVEVQILPPPGSAPLPQGRVSNVVLRGASDLRFSYFGSIAPGEQAAWHSEWLATDHLPTLVRIGVELTGTRRQQPPLVVALRQG